MVPGDRDLPGPDLAEALWLRYRSIADRSMDLQRYGLSPACDSVVRGAVYLFIVDLIAQVMDRIEREPEPVVRRALIDIALLPPHTTAARKSA